MKSKNTLILLLLFMSFQGMAQKGNPPKKSTHSLSVTRYPQHIDFLPSMVKLLKAPKGWEVNVAAYGLGKPRMMFLGPNGELYITRRDGGDVLMLKDLDKDNKFESLVTVAADFNGVHGITIKDSKMYLCNDNEIRRYNINGDGTLSKDYEVLVSGLPNGGQHPNRTMDFGPDGNLYLSIGSTCNDCKESNKNMATIVQINPATWEPVLFASGLRNTIGFDWHPQTGELWGIDNGGDAKGSKWPPEEVNLIKKDGNYGFPFAYGKRCVDQSREDPAGDTKEEWVKTTEPSVLELPAHMAPIGFQFFGTASNIPSGYKEDGLVCLHGSWNRKHPKGFKVVRIKFKDGKAVGYENFLRGFLRCKLFRKARFGRPAGIVIAPTGVVYISDDANGVIYAVKKIN